MEVLDVIRTRRSVRRYTGETVSDADIDVILEAGRWAPSGLNNQPWRFAVIRKEETKDKLAQATKYSSLMIDAAVIIAVFLDNSTAYDRTKDVQSIGACMQNMLLAAASLGLGACWVGQILAGRHLVEAAVGASDNLELMAVITLGHPEPSNLAGRREELDRLVFYREEA
ncbi:MAG TPA: nitroreductase [Candidatus Aquicultor sp.]|jgi:nitroreductase